MPLRGGGGGRGWISTVAPLIKFKRRILNVLNIMHCTYLSRLIKEHARRQRDFRKRKVEKRARGKRGGGGGGGR